MQTRTAETQRRRSTSSFRKSLDKTVLTTKVRDAEAGATRLRSPQESAVSRLKKPTENEHRASRNSFSLKILAITLSSPLCARSSLRSPIRFIAAESSTSPPLEPSTIRAIADQSSSDFMLLLGRARARFLPLGSRQCRTASDPAYSTTDQRDPEPA